MIDDQYLDLVRKVISTGSWKENRTGIKALSIVGAIIEHDMSIGFPLLTTKKVHFHSVAVELEAFIKGIRSKQWLKDRKCNIWNEWANPKKAPYGTDAESIKRMAEEDDLGPIYGCQWSDFGGVNQLQNVLDTLKKNPLDRRMIVSAWNPVDMPEMALPPCHVHWQVSVLNGRLNLGWYQRSCDLPLGIPFNIASYALLLHLLCKQTGLKEGKLIGFLFDVHIYENQLPFIKEQLDRTPFGLPIVSTKNFTDIHNWTYEDTKLLNYNAHPSIKIPIAV